MVNLESIYQEIIRENLEKKIVRIDLGNKGHVTGILYGKTIYTVEKKSRGIYLITFKTEEKVGLVEIVNWAKKRNVEIKGIKNSTTGDVNRSKRLREFEEELTKVQEEKKRQYEENQKFKQAVGDLNDFSKKRKRGLKR